MTRRASIWIVAANPEHWERKEFIEPDWEQDWEHWKHRNFSRPFDNAIRAVPLTLPVPQPALRPQASCGANLVCLGPLRLRLAEAFLEDLRYCCTLSTLQPRPDHFFPGIAFIACLLLIASQLHQVWCVEPPRAARFESYFGSAHNWSRTSARPSTSIRPQTTGQKRLPPVSSRK